MGINALQADSDLGNRAKSGAEDGIRGASCYTILLYLTTCRLVYPIAGILCLQYHLVTVNPQEYGGKMAARL